jgi:hypothetical protein
MERTRQNFRIPRALTLHKQKIRVRIVPDPRDAENDLVSGLYLRHRREILLEQYQPIDQLERSLIHEALHAAMPPRFSFVQEEQLVRRLELPVYRLVLALIRSASKQKRRRKK